jgi:GGDEF domain-containing protein
MAGDMTAVDLGQLEIERARYESLLDPTTGLPRWGLLLDRTAVALAHARRTGEQIAVLLLDDPHHPGVAYDAARVAAELQAHLRPDDTLARIGEQRFVVLCPDVRDDAAAAFVAHDLVCGTGLTCRLGVALSRGDDDEPEIVIARALIDAARTDVEIEV